ncbi:DUF5134 domain-containing protein [Streptomyces sp. NPDC001922]|uniref:DUF5134 domain-containing protein n=1 Tax=Streptomyces sp. NPDC001922 TaxID=3364624 RepID=UPI003686E5E6
MHGPPLVGWLLVVVCGASGAYLLVLRSAGPPELRRGAGGEALMGLVMAAMALPLPQPQPWSARAFAAVFAVLAVHGLLPARGDGHRVHHVVGSLAMVYAALAMPAAAGPGHPGHGAAQPPGGLPLVTGLLLGYFAVYMLCAGARLVPAGSAAARRPGPPPGLGRVVRPEPATACRVSTAMAMFAMLLTV